MTSIRDTLNANRDQIIAEYQSGASTVALGKKYACSNAAVYVFLRKCGVTLRQVANKYDDLIPDAVSRIAAGESVTSVAKATGIPKSTLGRAAARRGQDTSQHIKRCAIRLGDHGGEIEAMYAAGSSMSAIADRFGCDESNISRLLKRRGVETRFQYDCDHSFFDVIDAEEKAYSLGFFVADGYNHTNNVMSIRVTDLDVLQKIKSSLKYTGPIGTRPAPKRAPHHQPQYSLEIASPRISRRLTELGCPRNKTFVTRFPREEEVPKEFLRHYIRGVFDGDGSVFETTNGWHCGIAGTRELLEPMRQHIHADTGVKMGLYPQGSVWVVKVGGNIQVARVLDWLYEDATIFLDRKHQRYLAMKKAVGPRGRRQA